MTLEKFEEVLNIFNFQQKEYLKQFKIKCFRYIEERGNSFFIFTSEFNTQEDIRNYYSEINEIIALEFQSRLDKNIERWNLYIFYFIRENIPQVMKQLVEQDKYATRKIVIEDLTSNLDDSTIMQFINNKLFNLKIKTKNNNDQSTNKIDGIIGYRDSEFSELINEIVKTKKEDKKIPKDYLKNKVIKYLGVKYGE